jgi:hypothetical protein
MIVNRYILKGKNDRSMVLSMFLMVLLFLFKVTLLAELYIIVKASSTWRVMRHGPLEGTDIPRHRVSDSRTGVDPSEKWEKQWEWSFIPDALHLKGRKSNILVEAKDIVEDLS